MRQRPGTRMTASFPERLCLPVSVNLCVLKPENLKNEITGSKSWKGLTSHLKQRSSQTVKGKNDWGRKIVEKEEGRTGAGGGQVWKNRLLFHPILASPLFKCCHQLCSEF